jgi:hypothetical protein
MEVCLQMWMFENVKNKGKITSVMGMSCEVFRLCLWQQKVYECEEISWVGSMKCKNVEAHGLCGGFHPLGGLTKWTTMWNLWIIKCIITTFISRNCKT